MIANLALLIWPFVAIVFFTTMRLPTAVATTVLGGFLLLPPLRSFEIFTLHLDKVTIPGFTAVLMTAITLRARAVRGPVLPGWLPQSKVAMALILILLLSPFATMLSNNDTIVMPLRTLPALGIKDGLAMLVPMVTPVLLFLLGRKVFCSEQAIRQLLFVLLAGLALYTLPALYEVRMSPQMSNMVYGFFPHSWAQHVRSGGWRPIVFLSHGLVLGLLLSLATIAAAGLLKNAAETRTAPVFLALILLVSTLILSKTLGALIIALFSIAAIVFLSRRLQAVLAMCIAVAVILYPVLRGVGVVPVETVATVAAAIENDRASSFVFRLENEDLLLERANERPLFGWGIWSRNRVYDENGYDLSITDGLWVITIGIGGWARYIGLFGLLSWGLIAQVMSRRQGGPPGPHTATLSLVLAANMIDMIPNAGLMPVTWLFAGALMGRLEARSSLGDTEAGADPVPQDDRTAGSRLTRFPTATREAVSTARNVREARPVSEGRRKLSYRRTLPPAHIRPE